MGARFFLIGCAVSGAAALKVSSEDGLPKFLAVSAYWKLTPNDTDSGNLRTGLNGYMKTMKYTMTLNTPMVIFGDEFGTSVMKEARGNSSAELVHTYQWDLEKELEPCKSHSKLLRANPVFWTHPKEVPSVSLGCIWDGKMSLLAHAAREHPDYDLYSWVDIGMHANKDFRAVFQSHQGRPWPHPAKLAKLPLDKISISHSSRQCDRKGWVKVHPFEFWHCAAATAFVVPKALIEEVNKLYYSKLNECINFWKDGHTHTVDGVAFGGYACMSEQHILSLIAMDRPELFNWIGQGWGAAAANLTTDKELFAKSLSHGDVDSDAIEWLATDPAEEHTTKI